MGRRGAELILTPQLVGEVQRSVVRVGFPPYGTVVRNSSSGFRILYTMYNYTISVRYQSTEFQYIYICTEYYRTGTIFVQHMIAALHWPIAG